MSSSRKIPRGVDFSNVSGSVPEPLTSSVSSSSSSMSVFAKWVPLICAGAAVGVSVIALKEIKNTRRELIMLKKEQISGTSSAGNKELTKKIELMDEQLRKITEYLANQNKPQNKPNKKSPIIKEAFKTKLDNVKIINSVVNEDSDEEEEVEVEVTDDES